MDFEVLGNLIVPGDAGHGMAAVPGVIGGDVAVIALLPDVIHSEAHRAAIMAVFVLQKAVVNIRRAFVLWA